MSVDLSRRRLFGLAGAATIAGAAGASGLLSVLHDAPAEAAGSTVPFWAYHQAGIRTPQQDRLFLAAFDVTTTRRTELVALLRAWTDAAARLTAGRSIGTGADPASSAAPPDDTGEAVGLHASRLTLTIGFGGALLDRFGAARPAALAELPPFAGDTLDPERCGGDLVLQACADDPQVAVHAIRNLVRIAHGTAAIRWSQLGFGRTSSTTTTQQTPRNLFGFMDGTRNAVADQQLWVQPGDGPAWMTGGSYLVARRIAMIVETWDRTSLGEQETVIGRHKASGAPHGKTHERDPFVAADLPAASHVRQAHPETNNGAAMLRRGYSFVDGSNGLGHLDAGLFFLAYQRDPRTGFTPVQQSLAAHDAMNEYVRHTGSGLWACPPGLRPGGFWGDAAFAQDGLTANR